ncbi:MAG: hypothetical protein KA116_06880 [Proteobacteria bacterium]|nr:hypothetical protein [Pseudomonadota bacterium]
MRRGWLFFFLLATSAFSREYYDLFPTPRSIAMGRAVTAYIDDWESLYTNPAGLALQEESKWRLPDLIQAGVSPSISKLYKKIKNLKKNGSTLRPVDFYSFDGTAASFSIEVPGFGYYGKRFAMALNFLALRSSFRIRTPSLLFLKAAARVTQDTAFSLGFAQPFFDNHLRFGVAFRPVHIRSGMDRGMSNSSFLENQQLLSFDNPRSFFGMGWGSDLDIGTQWHGGPWGRFGFVPSLGAVYQNVLENDFDNRLQKNSLSGTVPPAQKRVNAGAAVSLHKIGRMRPTISVDYRDYLVKTDKKIEHLGIGMEFYMRVTRWLHGALAGHFYKGNLGGGAYGHIGPGYIAFVTEAVNLGRGPGIGVDRRYYVRASFEW